MPISNLQRSILHVIANNRSPDSVVQGGTVLNREGLRYSDDIDISHDFAEVIAQTAKDDADCLTKAGFSVKWTRQGLGHLAAEISGKGDKTKLEWSHDSDFRFFPVMKDDLFGYVLHPLDIATNKVSAAADRRVVRDVVDLMTIQKEILPLGAVVWAAVGKQVGFTPEGMLAEIAKNLNTFTAADFSAMATNKEINPQEFVLEMKQILGEANAFVRLMPPGTEGSLFLLGDEIVQPDPGNLGAYKKHPGQRKGHWPSSSEISTMMLAHKSTAKKQLPKPKN